MSIEIFDRIKKQYAQFEVDWQYRETSNREVTCSCDEFWIKRTDKDGYFVMGIYVNLKSKYISIRYINGYIEDINFKSDEELIGLLDEQINRVLIVCVVTDKDDLIHLFKYESSENNLQTDIEKNNATLMAHGYTVRANEFYSMYEHAPIVYGYELYENDILKLGNGLIDKVKERYKGYVTENYDEWENSDHHHNSDMPITQTNWFSGISCRLIFNVNGQEIYANFVIEYTYIGNLWDTAYVTIAYPQGEHSFAFDQDSLSEMFELLDKLFFTPFMQTAEKVVSIFFENLRNKNELAQEYDKNTITFFDNWRAPKYRLEVDIVELKVYSKFRIEGKKFQCVEMTDYKTVEELIDDIKNQMQKVYIICHCLNGDNEITEKFLSDFDNYEAEMANISEKKKTEGIENISFEIFSLLAPKTE